eukprot:gene39852-52601_t
MTASTGWGRGGKPGAEHPVMAEDDRKSTPDELDRRLKGVRQAYQAGTGRSSGPAARGAGGEKLGVGMRIAVELVAGVVAGAFLGLMADRWLGTKPWLLIVGFVLGCGAAFVNVYRSNVASPLEQFAIQDLTAPLFSIGGHHIAVTNSAIFMMGAVVLSSGLLLAGAGKGAMIPGRLQAMSELFYEFIANMIRDNVGSGGKKFFPFIFSLFIFTLFGNILGMLPYGYTFTSQIAVTFFMAMVVFLGVTLIGLFKHGLHFFSLFFPHGAPLFTAPILIPIELVSYLSRPISLS